eukprot:PhM_4_TR11235/c0_g2_i1/m.74077
MAMANNYAIPLMVLSSFQSSTHFNKRKKMSWASKSGVEKFAFIVMIIAMACIMACAAANIAIIVKSVEDTWFTPCGECADPKTKCVKCCLDCPSLKQKSFFYLDRGFMVLWCFLALAAETKLAAFSRYLKVLDFYFARGILHVFIGVSTIEQLLSPDKTLNKFIDACGYALIAMGFCHILLSCVCMGKAKAEGGKYEEVI